YDGRFVAFDYRPADHSEIYLVELSGGPPRLLPTVPGADNIVPSWSHDDNWKIPAGGGEETLVMKGTGLSDYANWTLSPGGIHFIRTGRADLPDPTLGDAI